MPENNDTYFSKTADKVLRILELFDREHPKYSLSEISNCLNINKTSTFRYVNTLIKLGYLKKNPNTKMVKLGTKSLALGQNFFYGFDFLQIIKPLIDQCFKEFAITIDSALFEDFSLVALYRREAINTLFFRHPLVSKDLHARSIGKAVLASMSDKQIKDFIKINPLKKFTDNTICDPNKLIAELRKTKNRGYSLNNEEYISGLISIGCPLINFQTNSVVGGVSFDFPAIEQKISNVENKYAGSIRKLANEISEMITIADS